MAEITEFDLIQQFFVNPIEQRKDVLLGIGDDAALLQPPPNQLLVTATDTLVAGVHFPENTDPADIGYKSLAVNLSDLAAMGAEPAWALLALTLPNTDKTWLTAFSQGFFELANRYNVQLVGGDTTRGPLTITVQVMGFVPSHQALSRSGAKPGDKIYVTGTLGNAGLALQIKQGTVITPSIEKEERRGRILKSLNRPEPRIETGLALRTIASSAIDISDGLAADLSHILKASKVGATIIIEQLPLSPDLLANTNQENAWQLALNAGDDYELCFTAPAARKIELSDATCIGIIEAESGLRVQHQDGRSITLNNMGYRHF